MQLVVEISEDTFFDLKKKQNRTEVDCAILNGTPLPKGHGDIIDRSKIEYMRAIHDLKWGEITASECATRIRYSAPTIIEMDKEQECN